jgi:ABC-2 type transport system permease protein
VSRVGTAVRAGAREYARTPVLLALFAFLPAYAVGLFSFVAPENTIEVNTGGEVVSASLPAVVASLMAPMSAALVAGIAGLFLMRSSRGADGRLVLAGYRAREVVLARIGLLAGVVALASVASQLILQLLHPPEAPVAFFAATVVVALIYGTVGALTGVLFERLAGVYLLLFLPLVDLFLFQNPLATDRPALATYLPSHFPMEAAIEGALGGAIATNALGLGAAYLTLLGAVVIVAFYRATAVGA